MILTERPKYRRFVNDRNKALEQLHANAQTDLAKILDDFLDRVMGLVVYSYSMMPHESFFTNRARGVIQAVDHAIDSIMPEYAANLTARIMKLKRHSFLLASSGEAEAVAQALGKVEQYQISSADLNKAGAIENVSGENLFARTILSLNRIKRDVLDAVEVSRVMEEDLEAMKARVLKCFPKLVKYKAPPRELKKVREADQTPSSFMVNVFADEDEWDDLLKAYKKSALPKFRFDNEELEGVDSVKYAWELEKELTHEFVDQVRKGQHEGAKKIGIKDFVWIAVLDDATCEDCCAWRDGLTTSEIEKALKTSKHKNDDCEALTPPAHFNCRCDLGPVSEEVSDKPDNDLGDFETWLQN
jgi:predicted metal-binding protein